MLEVLFYVLLGIIFHNYVLFPLSLRLLSFGKKQNENTFTQDDNLPLVSILLAAYNEESVIKEKIESTFKSNYPLDKVEFLIGSDSSTDSTDAIIESFQSEYPNLVFRVFSRRSGKVKIINELSDSAKGEILILTDANVMFDVNTIFELVKHFKEESIGLVGGNILNYNIKESGISYQEKSYLAIENIIKYQEGILWGTMMGAFGGIYALRKSLFKKVPDKFIVDDFYQTLQVIEQGSKAINELGAVAYEDVSNNISDEYNRKTRIGAGNYQNLFRFLNFLNPFKFGRFYSFVSHKLFRWAGPFIIISLLVLSFLLRANSVYKFFFIVQLALILVPLLDKLLKSLKVNNVLIRFINHFYVMNTALLIGFFKYLKGVKSSTWNPTKRFQ